MAQPADIALVVTVCQPDLPNESSTFRLALHPRSPSPIFYLYGDKDVRVGDLEYHDDSDVDDEG